MKKEKNYVALADEFRAMLGDTTPETMITVTPREDGILVTPADSNCTGAFFHLMALVDFCRCKRLDCFASYGYKKGDVITVIQIY